ncbi:MAG: S1 RNA-binding domain-containing protein [Alkalicoccus sp.]|nr:MAG: S1 RNA-binding domain-containing protein [Alkalicoccus sp.]
MAIEVGNTYQGKVTGITKFGAFVELAENKTGLVHISEISDGYVKQVGDHVSTGDEVTVKVLEIQEDGKIALSIRKAHNREEKSRRESRKQESPGSFENKMKQFLQDSEERLTALNKKTKDRRK